MLIDPRALGLCEEGHTRSMITPLCSTAFHAVLRSDEW